MIEKKIGSFNIVMSKLLPENKFLLCHPDDVEKLKQNILKFEMLRKIVEERMSWKNKP